VLDRALVGLQDGAAGMRVHHRRIPATGRHHNEGYQVLLLVLGIALTLGGLIAVATQAGSS
jgi:hypothetical protein